MPLHDFSRGSVSDDLLDYVEITASVTVTGTSAGAATTVIDGNAFVVDSSTKVCVEVFVPCFTIISNTGTSHSIYLELFDTSTDLGVIGRQRNFSTSVAIGGPCLGHRFLTIAAGSHTFHLKGWKDTSSDTAIVEAGSGGAGVELPAYLRVMKAP